jgi:hypothetical protein
MVNAKTKVVGNQRQITQKPGKATRFFEAEVVQVPKSGGKPPFLTAIY